MAEWRNRLSFLLYGKIMGEKYGLPVNKPVDRHKWLFCLHEAVRFVRERGKINGFVLIKEIEGYYRYRKWIARAIG